MYPLKISHLQRLLGLLLILLILLPLSAAAQVPGQPSSVEGLALVRVDLPNEAALKTLGLPNLQVYARLFTQAGGLILILPADQEMQTKFARQGHVLQVLERQVEPSTYYLLYGLEADLAKAHTHANILVQQGRQAVAKATPAQTQELAALGLGVQPLSLHPILTEPAQDLARPDLPDSLTYDPLVQRMIEQVESSTLYNDVGDLSGEWPVTINDLTYTLVTRYTGNEDASKKATRFAHEQFEAIGLPGGYHTYFSLYGWERRNVLAQQNGLTEPERIVLLTAHLDSISPNPFYNAPGADDNASGSAGVLAIADILKQYPFGCSLRYALFTGEEYGMYGSEAYAAYVHGLDENIEAVLNLDMIAYNSLGSRRSIELHTRPANSSDLVIANLFNSAVTGYQLGLYPYIIQQGLSFSDHSSFWNYGYPAILAIEDWTDHTPSYHTTNDRLSTLDMDYYTRFTKASLATFAHMGCLLSGELIGTVQDAVSGDPIPNAAIQVVGVDGIPWVVYSQADGAYTLPLYQGSYDISVSAGAYASGLVSGIAISHNQITTQDFALQAPSQQAFLPFLVLSSAAR